MAAAIVNVADFGVYPNLDEDQTDRFIAALRCIGKTVKGIEYGSGFFIGEGRYQIDFARAMRTLREEWEAEEREQARAESQQPKPRYVSGQPLEVRFENCRWNDL